MSDTITLRIPRRASYYGVARMVVGGLAANLELPVDALDELQLAIGSVLDTESLATGGDVILHVTVDAESLHASVGPLDPEGSRVALDAHDDVLDLRRVLDAIVDDVLTEERDGATWVRLVKYTKAHA